MRHLLAFCFLAASPTLWLMAQSADSLPEDRYSPTISPDGHLIVFQSNKDGDWNLYLTVEFEESWTAPVAIYNNLSSGAFLGGPDLCADGKHLVFFSDEWSETSSLDLLIAEFDPKKKTFRKPEPFPAPINTEAYEAFPSLSADGNTLFFVRDLVEPDLLEETEEGTWIDETYEDAYELMWARKNADGSWGEPQPIRFETVGNLGYPRIMPDGETLVFSAAGKDYQQDLYRSRWDGNSWSEPTAITNLNSPRDDKSLSATYNGRRIVFARQVEGEDFDLPTVMIMENGNPVPDIAGWGWVDLSVTNPEGGAVAAEVAVREKGSQQELSPVLEEKGEGQFHIRLRAGKDYLLTVSAPEHDFVSLPVSLADLEGPWIIDKSATLTPLQKEITIRLDNLTFAYNSAEITDSAATILDIAALFLQKNDGVKVEISAHTDDVGSPDFNLDLSEQRAAAVVEALVSRGASRERLIPKGYGESSPIADNTTEEGRAQNRRVEFRILED